MEYHCEHCGFSGQASLESCPVCLDGQADPWAIIRDIRSVLKLQGSGAAEPRLEVRTEADRFASEWPLLVISVRAIWNDLTPQELASVEADRGALESLLMRKYGYGSDLANQLCTGVEELHERFNGQWEVVRECVPKYWSEIYPRDIATMSGTMSDLAGLIGRRYGKNPEEARVDVASFLEKIDYSTLVLLFGGDTARPVPSGTPSAAAAHEERAAPRGRASTAG